MKFGFIADIHLAVQDPYSPLDSQFDVSIRTMDKLSSLETALKISVENECSHFFIGGDIFDKMNPPEKLSKLFWSLIAKYASVIDIVIFPGNHDGIQSSHNYESMKIMTDEWNLSNLRIIDQIQLITCEEQDFLIIPYTKDLEAIQKAIEEYRSKQVICLGHLEIIDALSSTEINLKMGLPKGLFTGFKVTFLGHYHRRQHLLPNLSYVGSPNAKDFSELGIEKGFIIYDTDNEKETFYQLENRNFYQFDISPDTLDAVDEILESTQIPPGSVIKLKISGSKLWIKEALPMINSVFNEFKPLKLIRNLNTVSTKEELEVLPVLGKSRYDRIVEAAKDKPESYLEIGLALFNEVNMDTE